MLNRSFGCAKKKNLPLLIKSGRVILGLKKLKGKGKGAGGQVGQ